MESTTGISNKPPQTQNSSLPSRPADTTISSLAKKLIPFDLTGDTFLDTTPSTSSYGKIEVSPDQNTLLAIWINDTTISEPSNDPTNQTAYFNAVRKFLEHTPNIKQAQFVIHSATEAQIYFSLGIAPPGIKVLSPAELANSGALDSSIFANLGYPQTGVLSDKWINFWDLMKKDAHLSRELILTTSNESGPVVKSQPSPDLASMFQTWIVSQVKDSSIATTFCNIIPETFLNKLQIISEFLSSNPLDVYEECIRRLIKLMTTIRPRPTITTETKNRILSKPERKFIIEAGRHSAVMVTKVFEETGKMQYQFIDLTMNGKSISDIDSLTSEEKFILYRAAILRFLQYSEKFPLPQTSTHPKQQFAEYAFLPSDVFIHTNSRKLVNILCRLGFVPEEKRKPFSQFYIDANIEICPKRKAILLVLQGDLTALDVEEFMQLTGINEPADLLAIFKKNEDDFWKTIKHLSINLYTGIATAYPLKPQDVAIRKLNNKIEDLLKLDSNQELFKLAPIMMFPWEMTGVDAEELPKIALEEFKMFQRSYQLREKPTNDVITKDPLKADMRQNTFGLVPTTTRHAQIIGNPMGFKTAKNNPKPEEELKKSSKQEIDHLDDLN